MIVDLSLLALGILLLTAGGSLFVTGATRLAQAVGISELLVGLTVVAFGTSAPELAVNVLAALRGDSDIAFGNVVGSNIANVGLVLGLAALLRPLAVERALVAREIPVMLAGTAMALLLGLDVVWGEGDCFDRADGAVLLMLFVGFLASFLRAALADRSRAPDEAGAASDASVRSAAVLGRAVLATVAGLVALVGGAQLTVVRADALAADLGVSPSLIGLTLVALGTSLPELVTTLVATRRGQVSLAIGNVVGSNVFNLLFVLGTTSVLVPVDVPTHLGRFDLGMMAFLAFLLLPLVVTRHARIPRVAGLLLAGLYVGYVVWRVGG